MYQIDDERCINNKFRKIESEGSEANFIPFAKNIKRIKTDFSQFVDQFMLNRNYVKQPAGIFAKVLSKIASFATLQYVNYLSGRPIDHVKYALD